MIPFRDHNPSGSVPLVTFAIIALNIMAFFVELQQGDRVEEFIGQFGLTPARLLGHDATQTRTRVIWPLVVRESVVREYTVPAWLTVLTSMFLHGGWLHLLGNMWYLWIFGDNVEDRMGHVKFALFYLLCGLGAAAFQVAVNSRSSVPMVGASGAIAGVLGAYLVAFPTARISTLIPLGFFITVVQLPAVIVLGFWFLIQFLSGLGSTAMAEAGGGVAWWAHIGGFVVGMALLFVLQKPPESRRAYVYRRYR